MKGGKLLRKNGLLGLGRGAGRWIVLSSAMLFINGTAFIIEILLISRFIASGANLSRLPLLLTALAAILIVKAGVSKFESRFSCRITLKVKYGIRDRIFTKIGKLGPAYVDHSGTAELVGNSLDGVEALEVFFGRFIPQLIYSLVIPLILFFVTHRIYPAFAWVLLAAVPVIPLSMGLISSWAAKSMRGYWDDYQGLSSLFLENLQGITTLKLFNRSEKRMDEMESKAWGFRNSTMELLRMQLTSISVMDTLVYGFAAVGIFMAIRGLYIGRLELDGFFILLMLSVEFFLPIRKLGSLFHAGVNGIQAGRKIAAFLSSDEPCGGRGGGERPEGSDIVFENVSFSYGEGLPNILSDTSCCFPAGGTYGIAGPSGCGKSTLGRMLLRFYDPEGGTIRLGGAALAEISRSELRRRITLVEAHSRIFDGTIEDNLRLAMPDAGVPQMLDACGSAGLGGNEERRGLVNCSDDLKTRTGEGGSLLSGGERQRLAIARAVLLDPDIYVFDEAAGSVDAESEEIIKDTIYSLPAGKTVFIISHRMSMLEKADRLITIDEGRIVVSDKDIVVSGGRI